MKHYLRTSYLATRKARPQAARKKKQEEEELVVEVSLAIHDAGIFPISWIFCPSLLAVKELLLEHGISEESAVSSIIQGVPAFVIPLTTDEDLRCLVYITPDGIDRGRVSDIAGLIAHEANHVVMEGLKYINEDKPSAELTAYFQQYVTQSIMTDYFDYHNLKDELHG